MVFTLDVVFSSLLLVLPAVYYLQKWFLGNPDTPFSSPEATPPSSPEKSPQPTVMQPERTDLQPPKDDAFTLEQLKQFDGSDPSRPIYVAIKGACYPFRCVIELPC